jgi:hypothetical protein
MKRCIIGCLAVALLAVAAVPRARAQDSRAQSLLYNLTFEDQTDVFLFPHLLNRYEGLYFHLPANINNVFGGLIYDLGGSALGIFVHRPVPSAFDQYRIMVTDAGLAPAANVLAGLFPGNPGAASEAHVAGQIFDLMYGQDKWGISLRLWLFSEISQQEGMLADPAENTGAFTADLNAGFNLSPGFDMRGGLAFRHEDDIANMFMIKAGMRYMEPGDAKARLVVAGELQIGAHMPEDGDTSFALGLPFKAGFRLCVVPERVYVGVLGGVDVQVLKLGDQDMRLGLAIPVVELASEWYALSWLHVRTAVKAGYGIQFAGDPNDNTPKYEQLAFSSGVGIPLGPFEVDGVVQYQMWQNGPWAIGGVPGLFAGVTVSYAWGDHLDRRKALADVFSAPVPEPAPAPTPQAAPPPPAPPPAPPPPAPTVEEDSPETPAAGTGEEKTEGMDME